MLAEEGRADESLIFYEEAIRLEPGFARGYHNLGYAYQHLGQLEEALDQLRIWRWTVSSDPTERLETSHSRSICLIGAGKLEEGFREYEIRNNERFRAYTASRDQGAALEWRACRRQGSCCWWANRAWATNSCSPISCPT